MRPWHIEWTQTTDGEEEHFTDAFVAETPALAIAQWAAKSYCNAQIDAVYNPLKAGITRARTYFTPPPSSRRSDGKSADWRDGHRPSRRDGQAAAGGRGSQRGLAGYAARREALISLTLRFKSVYPSLTLSMHSKRYLRKTNTIS